MTGCNGYGCTGPEADSNSSAIYESALGQRRQYTSDAQTSIDDQESLQVNVADGNLLLQADDFSLPGVAGFGYQFTRSYNSRYSTLSPSTSELSNPNPLLAPSWEDVPNLSFFTNPNTGDARYTGDGGYEITFTKSGSSFTSPPGSDATLIQQGDGTFLMTFHKSRMEDKFNSSGQLVDEYDQNGNAIAFSWSSGQLATVTDTTGRTTTFHYTAGQMTSITAPGNCSGGICTYTYTYDSNGRLSTFKDPLNATTTYGYNAAGLLSSVKNPLNNEWAITYDSQNRVKTITGGLNSSGGCPTGGVCPQTTFAYTAAPSGPCSSGMETDLTDPSSYTTTYCTDGRARVSEVNDPVGNTTSADYTDTLFGGSNCVDGNGITLDDQPCARVDGLNKVTQYGYDSTGQNQVWEQNPLQTSTQRSSWAYGDSNNPYYRTSFTDANGNRTNFAYDPTSGNLTSTTSGLNSSGTCPTGTICPRTDHIYATNGELQADKIGLDSTDACASGTPCSRTDYTYYSSNTSNGTIGDLASMTTGLNLSDSCPTGTTCSDTTYFYDAAGNQTSQVDPLGNVSGGNPANYTTSSTFDQDGRLLSEKDELGNTTSYGYDAAGNQTTVKDPATYLTCDVYDANNRLMSETDGLASTSVCPTTLTCPASSLCPKTSYVYYANGDLETETDPNGQATGAATGYVYDGDHNLTSQTDPLGNTTSYGYDADGNQTLMIEPRGYGTQYGYNAIGQLTSEQSGLTQSGGLWQCVSPSVCPLTTNHYDLAGNEDWTQDAYGQRTTYSHDADNRLTSTHGGLNSSGSCPSGDLCPTTSSSYDAEGNPTKVVDPNGYETTYSYDPIGNKLSQQSGLNTSGSCPSGSTCPTTSFTYDANGNLATKTLPAASGHAITYTDDYAGQLKTITYPSGYSTPNVSYTYDGDGNTKTMTDGAGTATYTYNNLDQVTNETRGSGTDFNYTYDADGNITGREYPDATWHYSAYDAGDELCLASTSSTATCGSSPSGVAYTAYTYTAAGDVKTTQPVNSSGATIETETRTYDSADFLKDITTTNNGGSTVAEIAYTLDNMGMPTTIARTGTVATGGSTVNCTVDDTYDNNEQISIANYHSNCPSGGISYSYTWDADGNRTKLVNGGTTTNYAYNNLDELCAKSSGTPSCSSPTYTYNLNGNELTDSSAGNAFSYDLENRLLSATNSGVTTSYSYDGAGNMLSTTASGATTSFLWDSNSDNGNSTPQLALNRNGSLGGGTLIHRYVYGLNRISESDSGQTYYYTYDGLDSVLNLLNASSTSQYAYVYNTFGANRATYQGGSPPPNGNEMKFIAQRLDPSTGSSLNLYDTTVRNLDTSTGRFLSQDPASSTGETAGSYPYGNDNPDTYSDPTGEEVSTTLSSDNGAALTGRSGVSPAALQGQGAATGCTASYRVCHERNPHNWHLSHPTGPRPTNRQLRRLGADSDETWIIDRESSRFVWAWNPLVNTTGYAYGLGQITGAFRRAHFGGRWESANARIELRMMKLYIRIGSAHFHTPAGAKAWWEANGWY